MRPLLVLLALSAPAAAGPTCDPDAPPGDRDPLIGHYLCQVSQNNKAGDTYPCEIIAGGNQTGYLRTAKLGVTCVVSGTIDKNALAGSLYCTTPEPYLDAMATVAAKLRSIAGGFAVEVTTDVVRSRVVDPKDTRVPRKTIEETERVSLAVTVCRKPWPRGFKNEVEELEKHPPK